MNRITIAFVLALVFLATSGNVLAYEGGTKYIATMTHPERGEAHYGPLVLVPHDFLAPSKPVLMLRRIPMPTLSREGMREETAGPSTGTKRIVKFQGR